VVLIILVSSETQVEMNFEDDSASLENISAGFGYSIQVQSKVTHAGLHYYPTDRVSNPTGR
jgi:hypothetical protein